MRSLFPNAKTRPATRHVLFGASLLVSVLAFWVPIQSLMRFALDHDWGTHIFFIVPLSLYFIYLNRDNLSSSYRPSPALGSIVLLVSAIVAWLVTTGKPEASSQLSLQVLTLVMLWLSSFVLCYGPEAFSKVRFPLLFLFLLVPIPEFIIDKAIFWLQGGSASVAYWLLRAFGVPTMREGFFLHLPALDLEVEKECSGIRSSLVLFVTTLVAGQFVLRSFWSKSLLLLAIIPIVIFKNGLRIVSIALLTLYVNRAFLQGWLHRSGGIVFYLLGLLALYPVIHLLRRLENLGPQAKAGALRARAPQS